MTHTPTTPSPKEAPREPIVRRKRQKNTRLSAEAIAILEAGHRQLGISQSDVMEMALRAFRDRYSITVPETYEPLPEVPSAE